VPLDPAPDEGADRHHLQAPGTYVVKGGNHSTIFDSTADHAQAVSAFFRKHAGAA